MRVLLLGATGLLGPYLGDAAAALGSVTRSGFRGGDVACDATDPAALAALVGDATPDLTVNAIGYTDVDGCENDPALADRLNRQVVANIVAAAPADATLLHISTDQVYPGTDAPYGEDVTDPINEYGRSKRAGETEALRHPNALVLRVNFFGPSQTPGRKSLSDWMIASLANGDPMTLFEDSLFSPLHLESVGRFAMQAVERGLRGVYNLGCRDGASKADFGYAIARHLGLDAGNASRGISADMPGRARRPKDMRMDVGRIEAALGCAMPTLGDEIRRLKL